MEGTMRGLWRRAVVAGLAVGFDLLGVQMPTSVGERVSGAGAWLTTRLRPLARAGVVGPMAITGSTGSAVAGRALEQWSRALPEGLGLAAEALLLKEVLSVEAVRKAARQVSAALARDDIGTAREIWSRSPVLAAVPCDSLDATEMAQVATSRVAAQANSHAVAPLFYYAVGGLPAALAYRWLSAELAHAPEGRFGEHMRRLAMAVPAWASAGLMKVAAELRRADSLGAERVQRTEGRLLEAPARAATVRVMSGALGVRLVDQEGNAVNVAGRSATPDDLQRAGSIVGMTVGLAGGLLLVAGLAWKTFGPRGDAR